MAYQKRAIRRRAPRRRRVHLNPVKRYITTRRNVKWGRIANDVKMLKGLINTEIKYLDQNHPGTTDAYWDIIASTTVGVPAIESGPPTPGYVHFTINYPAIGDDFNDREGRSLKLKSVQLKGVLGLYAPSASPGNSVGGCRIFIIVDHQAQQGEVTNPVPILFQPDQNGHYTTESRVNRQRNKRYAVLASKSITMGSGAIPKMGFNLYKKLNDKIKFEGGGASDFMDKCFHVVVLPNSNYPVVGSNDYNTRFSAQFNTRITYIDN